MQQEIESEIDVIGSATRQQLPAERIGYLWAVLASKYRKAGNFTSSEKAYLKSLELQRNTPSAARNYATTLDNFGMLYLVYGKLDEATRYNRMGEKVREGLGIPLELARSKEHLAEIDLARHRFKQAEMESMEALEVMRAVNDPEPLDRIAALNGLAFTHCLLRRCAEGLAAAQESVALAKSSFGADSMPAAHAMMALGFASWKGGRLQEAEPAMRSAIETMRAQPVPAGRSLLLALIEYQNYLTQSHRDEEADNVTKELTTEKALLAKECASCVNVQSLLQR
ncbi:MAG: tetratricopeptide repeat protein [Edaphobacter sp.]|uniref:tetratricopeptide repeat protein n=1 Tax=Edaphobacter sp. TaxID=1934404 RepID=UPI0023841F4B|nr:tetratricopeptide repeat protein [Edaphobacter sp.]MDE1177383.1 tetratricopeptide repeat protein [Edaphobacter sp.]